jgi:flagellar hook protein FlgE
MSLFGSLYSGVSGLSAQSRSMGMISDNVANVNTTGYKGAAAQFATLVTRAAGASTYSPGGVRSMTQYTIDSQGLIQSSASPTDVAISGAGFFVINTRNDGTGDQLYSRAGSFKADNLGFMTNPSGAYLQGWRLDDNGNPVDVNTLEAVNIAVANGVAKPTTAAAIAGNLDADQPGIVAPAAGAMAEWAATGGTSGTEPHFTRDVQVFDSLGRARNVTMAFIKTDVPNEWAVEIHADPGEVETGAFGLLTSGTITFDGQGKLSNVTVGSPVTIDWLDAGGADDSTISFDFGTIGGTDGLIQLGAETDIAATQDGASVGRLNNVVIDADGYVVAAFTNGEQQRIYKLPVATFPNPSGLDPQSGNLYAASEASGNVLMREAGTAGAGVITPSALEAANVDLAEEFTKMIITQRAYSANARVISTADEMLDELVRLR